MRALAAGLHSSALRKSLSGSSGATEQQAREQGFLAACYERAAREANAEGEYFLAVDSARHGLRCAAAGGFPTDELRIEEATALARAGATQQALALAREFVRGAPATPRLLSTIARLHRDIAMASVSPEERHRFFGKAASFAQRALRILERKASADWAYPTGQQAIFTFLAGDRKQARTIATALKRRILKQTDVSSFWNQTNLAEMSLVAGDFAGAANHYAGSLAAAKAEGRGSAGDVASNRIVARLLLEEWSRERGDVDVAILDEWIEPETLVVFSGHMPDGSHVDETTRIRRLPERVCRPGGAAAQAIKRWLHSVNAREGICASAPGGDILFAEQIVALGGRVQLVEPFSRAVQRAVAERCGRDWPARLERVWEAAHRRESVFCGEEAVTAMQCHYSNRVMLGSAILRARRIGGRLEALVLCEENAGAIAQGGAAEFAALCARAGVEVHIIDPKRLK